MTLVRRRPEVGASWASRARCSESGRNPNDWFSDRAQVQSYAVAVCSTCPVQLQCLGVALCSGSSLEGVWGGMTSRQRASLLRRLSEVGVS